ncbi:hypothetical protein QJS10_CPA06g00148 [Acorus calamus]|uniref:glycerol-3-phosphate dehydrogenase n=1 Tax=Acorus calamus TaxID=4465 RepID=A0AAV9EJG2_ACOCL|nr:hypothetical protein QJS10_CPA06g00148 [Acorus calamus]
MAAAASRLRRIGAAVAASGALAALSLRHPDVSECDSGAGAGGAVVESLRRRIADPTATVPPRAVQEAALMGRARGHGLRRGPRRGLSGAPGRAGREGGLLFWDLVEEDAELYQSVSDVPISWYLMTLGVRYLEKAFFNVDYGQLKLVFHALAERKQVIDNAPHLCQALPCMTPCFDWFEVVYYWMGLKVYDLVAGPRMLHLSRYYSVDESIELFPTLARKGHDKTLKGTVVYYDGQMNDARLNVGLACTAALAGAAVLNHAEVISFLRDDLGERIIGVRIRDNLSGIKN